MAIILPNMPKWFKENPPKILNCKYCGAEAEVRGKPDFEWWTYEIGCSKYCFKSSENHTRLNQYNIEELVLKWNKLNESEVEE